MRALFFPPPFTGEGDREAVEGGCAIPSPSASHRCAMQATFPVNGGGKVGHGQA
jgi:hypothetical protein